MKKYKLKFYVFCLLFLTSYFLLYYNSIKAQEIVSTSTTQIIENNFPKEIIFTKAMWYGKAFNGKKMANGKKFDMNDSTLVAHRTLPLGTKIKITNMKNEKTIDAVVSDRGPYSKNKKTREYLADIDISYAGAKILEFDKAGIANVKIKVY